MRRGRAFTSRHHRGGSDRKRGTGRAPAPPTTTTRGGIPNNKSHKDVDWEISSIEDNEEEEDDDNEQQQQHDNNHHHKFDQETPDEKRIRLAKALLERVGEEEEEETSSIQEQDDNDDNDNDLDHTSRKLHRDLLRDSYQLGKPCATQLVEALNGGATVSVRSHQHDYESTASCIALCESETVGYVGCKNGQVFGFDVESGVTTWTPPHDNDELPSSSMLAIAVSWDGKYVAASGDRNGSIRIWDVRSSSLNRVLTGHRETTTCLAFRLGSYVLASGSMDRSIRVWNAAEGSFISTAFGHQSEVLSIDALARERAVTSGMDHTTRLWKLPEESHLMFSGHHHAPIDCVRLLSENVWCSGSQDGNLALWTSTRRRASSIVPLAHGPSRWINCVAAMRNSDVIASGSDDGFVRLWRVQVNQVKIDPDPIAALPVIGHVNGMAFGHKSRRVLVVAHGRELRLGRWKVAKNAIAGGVKIFRLPLSIAEKGEGGDDDND